MYLKLYMPLHLWIFVGLQSTDFLKRGITTTSALTIALIVLLCVFRSGNLEFQGTK